MSRQAVTGTFTGTGTSSTIVPWINTGNAGAGQINVMVRGTFVATVTIEQSFDQGANWSAASRDSAGTDATYTAPFRVVIEEPEAGVLYRLNCTAYTSGTVTYRMSQ